MGRPHGHQTSWKTFLAWVAFIGGGAVVLLYLGGFFNG